MSTKEMSAMGIVELLVNLEDTLFTAHELVNRLHLKDYKMWKTLIRLVYPDVEDYETEPYSEMTVEELVDKLIDKTQTMGGPNVSPDSSS